MNHTPGPWGIETSSQGLIVVGSNEQPVVLIPFFSEGEWEKDEWKKLDLSKRNVELAANARMIAAAPELYKALRDLFEAVVIPEEISIEAGCKARIRARDILLKLRGEEGGECLSSQQARRTGSRS